MMAKSHHENSTDDWEAETLACPACKGKDLDERDMEHDLYSGKGWIVLHCDGCLYQWTVGYKTVVTGVVSGWTVF